MFELGLPWILLLLPAPFIYRWLRRPEADTAPALRSSVYNDLLDQQTKSGDLALPSRLSLTLLTLIWLLTLFAAAQPLWVGESVALPAEGRDLLLAVDLSGSMKEEDMVLDNYAVDRLTAVKAVVGEFVRRRKGDRLGLILFGTQPYLQAPLTFDRKTVFQLLQEAQIGFAGSETAIGDAIALGVKRLLERPESTRVMILLTDGANTAGKLSPDKAIKLANHYGVKIYTVGIGADRRAGLFGFLSGNPSSNLDEDTLQTIARQTGGRYFRARNTSELEKIYAELDQLEPVDQEAEKLRPTRALFYWPLSMALLFFFLLLALKLIRGLRHA